MQQQLVTMLLHDSGELFVVGAPRQSIYGFRGVVPDVFEEVEFPVVELTRNYRSTQETLDVAAEVMGLE